MTDSSAIHIAIPPSGTGCVECDQVGGWWFHLRRCATCGHIGCCDSSPAQHARAHAAATGHRLIRSFEPGEHWYYDYLTDVLLKGPELVPPLSHPEDQPVPGPEGRVPDDWRDHLH